MVQSHNFDIRLGFTPSEKAKIKMDGKELRVCGLTVRADAHGFTNVILQMEAPAVMELVAAALVQMEMDDEAADKMSALYDEVRGQIAESVGNDGTPFEQDAAQKAAFVAALLQQAATELTGQPVGPTGL